MTRSYQERVNTALDAIAARLPSHAAFAQRFFHTMPLQDLERLDAAHAAHTAEDAFAFLAQREGSAPKIRVLPEGARLSVELLNDDMPFLVDSLSAELARLGFVIHETIHPIFHVTRDASGALTSWQEGKPESFIHFELSAYPPGVDEGTLLASLENVLALVRASVRDWPAVLARLEQAASLFGNSEEEQENRAFLRWLAERNFVFLGYHGENEKLGVCAMGDYALPGTSALPLEVTKSAQKSKVHRPVLMDVVRVGAHQFFGLFTSGVYYQSVTQVPLLRRKLATIMQRSGFDPQSHDGKALSTILEFLPRDEMFQTSEEVLFEVAIGILALENKPAVRLFARADAGERFVSVLAFVPREHFSTELRKHITQTLATAFNGEVENFSTQITEAPLARLHFILRTRPGQLPQVDIGQVESDIARATHLWSDELRAALVRTHGEAQGSAFMHEFAGAFPQGYVTRYDIGATVYDIGKASEAVKRGGLALDFYRRKEDPDSLHLKIYNPNEEIALSDILPMLEHFGLRAIEEQPFRLTPASGGVVWIRDFRLSIAASEMQDLASVKQRFEEALLCVWAREMESDRLNALVLKAALSAREVTMLRAYSKYLRQAGFTYGQEAIAQALVSQSQLARLLVRLFDTRFDPSASHADHEQQALQEEIESRLSSVQSLTEDRILRQFVALLRATLRTNYYQRDRQVLSFKFRSSDVPGLPKPLPYAEIFVYSVRVEGIHLRGGKVARGGLRWSDRPEDFRTEVLGLMKAQFVKNAVIVPTGSKGGFVVKNPPATREAMQAEGVACYKLYLSGLLDITDNIKDGSVAAPARVVRYDGDDPYLVVAADKGTATFSDIANGISAEYGFWLGDAFASGGSAGYDHKKMGITARGAWVSVTRHFQEMGVDIAKEHFTCVGIGDMAGDVFGNGMLLSDNILLLAAFNHQHIFIDPVPDAKKSFAERQRLFNLPRSSWKDYGAHALSQGGGIYERSAKTIELSPQAVEALKLPQAVFTPEELIRALLMAPVDLLWNGGIGTYVKAAHETHDQVGDRANNALRVNGAELRCKVVGEGGNLGFTQAGRIEYARLGGRINTDAIDNSAGVDCSDHEVNIKIAYAGLLNNGTLKLEARDAELLAMTDEVGQLVLKDNFLQTQAITFAQSQGAGLIEPLKRLMQRLERQGLLARDIEYLPTDAQLDELQGKGAGLTRPELAVLMAYSKIALFKELVDSTLPDEGYFAVDLARYFPKAMQERHMEAIKAHPLKREIIATVATNSLVNRVGMNFFFDMQEETNLPAREVVAAYSIARDAFSLRGLWKEIEDLPGLDTSARVHMQMLINRVIERATLWCLRNRALPIDVEAGMAFLKPGVEACRAAIDAMHSSASFKAYGKVEEQLREKGVPDKLARSIASLEMLGSAGDIALVASHMQLSIAEVGAVYFAVGAEFRLGWLRHYAGRLKARTHWDRLAARALVQELYDEQRRITASILEVQDTAGAFDRWKEAHAEAVARYAGFMEDLRAKGVENLELSALMVALRAVKAI